ncbi:lysosomal-associated transmembrane protein 4B [Episyrphus balteatus]|uniref:lysosomal-associated transmembrane protein 4B n=1 Tax=Episyrphus balteatus TaxID=286459 RepID=UPI00248689AA|nr:lysosomal-associated transmembrane protein 4B [Episyrphus balteatus]
MLRIRLKRVHARKEWTCCFGLHVHTVTILIGLWHLFLNFLALSFLAVIWHNPKMVEELENSYDYSIDLNAPALPTPLSKIDSPYPYRDHSLNYQNFDMGGLVCLCMITITLMMIYGTLKSKPSQILPFFCLQLFDFAITTLTAAGYLCYLQSVHRLIAESHRLPWREKLLELSPNSLILLVFVTFVSIVFIKAYAIGIVWRCYKYLTLRQHTMGSLMPCVMHDVSANMDVGEAAYTTILPNYDEAIAQYIKQVPPPSYQVAISNIYENFTQNESNNAVGTPVNACISISQLEPPPYNANLVDNSEALSISTTCNNLNQAI